MGPSASIKCNGRGERQVLTRIKTIKGFGVFDNYSMPANLPPFGRYNVVYGENGSGKTTLSRFFASLEAGAHPEYPNLEFEVESQSGQLTNGKKYGRKVRVFNSDYVDANIGRFEGPMRPILIVGQENKDIADELKKEIALHEERSRKIKEYGAAVEKLETEKGKLFSQIAKTIGEAIVGSTVRSYRKPEAEAAFENLNSAKSLSEEELAAHRATVRQEQMASLGSLDLSIAGKELIDGLGHLIELASKAAERTKKFTIRSVQSAVIERLAQNLEIAAWVERGVVIHAAHSEGRCEFCDQPMPADRLKMLADHFSIEDQELKSEIDRERDLLRKILSGLDRISIPNRLAFYSELRGEFDRAVQYFERELVDLKAKLTKIDEVLAKKLALRTTAYESNINSDTTAFADSLNNIRIIIERHNEKTEGFDNEKKLARAAIEAHYLLTIKPQVDEILIQNDSLQTIIEALRNGNNEEGDKRSLDELLLSISEKQARISNAHTGGANLTEHLKQFLGRTDLRFVSDREGYRVFRRGTPAKRLSEGEKTAIAFLYFLVQLKDQDFDASEGIVVIDDPISSLDASAIYQAFSFLKNETQTAKQIFILTHNFEFLKLLINWVQNIPKTPKVDKTFTMVLCAETADGRFARLATLDSLLVDHATEYHYLFKVLHNFKSDGTILGCYHIPNIARKVLETFLDFHVPSGKSLYLKLEETDFDPHKKTAIYKFANDLSHYTGKGFDPALVAEAQKNTSYLLEMIESVAPLHYKGLKKLSEV